MRLGKYTSKTFQIVCWSTTLAMSCFLASVCLMVFHVNLSTINDWLETAVQRIKWQQVRAMAPHFVNASYWIPYWCAIILMFLYKERVRFMFWLNKFSLFGLILTSLLFISNQAVRQFWPEICGRSENFLHSRPYENCQLFFVSGAVVTGLSLLAIFCLRGRQWIVKVMLTISSICLLFAALLQGSFFPLQLLIAVGIAAVAAGIGYVQITLTNQEHYYGFNKNLKV